LKLSEWRLFLFHRLGTVLKHRVHPLALLGGSLAIVVLLTALSGMWHYQYELAHISHPSPAVTSPPTRMQPIRKVMSGSPLANSRALPSSVTNNQIASQAGSNLNRTSAAGAAFTTSPAASDNVTGPTVASSAPVPATVPVLLSINNVSKGKLTILSTSNQCEVLSAALQAGLISNLDMRYNSQYKTYAVYVIDNIGDSGAIWWAYTVNDKRPPYGCSSTPVHSGDSINWQYVKQ
jgi:hypothetical protein